MKKKVIVWFRTDLRVHDHLPLYTAWKERADILPIYIFDPHFWGKTASGFPKTGPFRTKFILESVLDLKITFQKLGSELCVFHGDSADIISEIAGIWSANAIYFYHDPVPEEFKISDKLEQKLLNFNIEIRRFWGHTLIDPENISFGIPQCPDVFSEFRKRVEKNTLYPDPLPAPDRLTLDHPYIESKLPSLQDLNVDPVMTIPKQTAPSSESIMIFKGGETEALKRLDYYFREKTFLKNYKHTRNELLGVDHSTKLSAWLSLGCISSRKIYAEIDKFEKQIVRNESTYWLSVELLWRDYFLIMARKHGGRMFKKGGLSNFVIETVNNNEYFDKWINGATGYPLIDANMRELHSTGFISNRGRQNVASFLIKNLGLDWRKGAEWFESLLIDYNPCVNYGNWNFMAGIGFTPRGFRFLDITKQAQEYDSKGVYIKFWLPVLSKLHHSKIFEPWKCNTAELNKLGIIMGKDYPLPIVDLKESAKNNELLYKYALKNQNYRPPSLIRKFANFSNSPYLNLNRTDNQD